MSIQILDGKRLRGVYWYEVLNIFVMNLRIFATRTGFLFSALLLTGLFASPQALAADYTVCGSGCDFATFTEALQFPGLGTTPDTVTLDATYVFDDSQEDDFLSIPSNVTISCVAGADTLGETGATEWSFGGGSSVTWQDCTFENMTWDFTGATNVDILNNTWTNNPSGLLVFTFATDITIRDNNNIQRIQIQTAHDMVIEDNTFACRFDNTCLYVGVAGGPDFSIPADVSGNVLIQDNIFTNYKVDNGGDWISINGGNNIVFQNNRVESAVTLNDNYLTMINLNNGQAEFKNNVVITPLKQAPQNAATVPFNVRTDVYDTNALYEHNTIIRRNGDTPGANQNSCFTLFDGGGHPNVPVNITARYNLCDQDGTTARGQGFQLQYVLGSTDLTLVDSFNGFSNIADAVSDSTNTITTVNPNTVTRNALLRRENVSTADDLLPSPISVYFDADGTTDIGAFMGVRETPILIDDTCVVDYVTCHGQTVFYIQQAIKPGEEAFLAAGTYPAFIMQDFDDITITGAGDTTIIDGGGSNLALQLINVTNSHFKDMAIKNSTDSTDQYVLTMDTNSTSMLDYNTFGIILYFTDTSCGNSPVPPSTATDVTAFPGVGTEDLNLFLIQVPGGPYITGIAPPSIANSKAQLAANCGVPDSFIDYFIPSFLALDNGEYTFDDAALDAEGIFPTGGGADPVLAHLVTAAAGLSIINSSDNVFTNVFLTDNARGLALEGTSDGNIFRDSDLTGNAVNDIFVSNTGNTVMDQTAFDRPSISYDDVGTITVQYKARVFVQDPGTAPVEDASVIFKDASNNVTGPLTTDASGLTPYTPSLPGITLSQLNPTGVGTGGNPYTITASKTGSTTTSIQGNLQDNNQQFLITMPAILVTTPLPSGGTGGGGGFSPTPPNGTNTPETPPPDTTVHPSPTEDFPSPTNPLEIVTEMQKLLVSFPGYSDLPKTDPAYIAFAYAYQIGAIQGFGDGTVGPQLLLQRDQIAKLVATSIYRISNDVDYCQGVAPFPDVPLDHWAAQYICFGKTRGILTGYFDHGEDAGKFKPDRVVSRVELVAILTRALPKMKIMGDQGNYSDIFPGPWYIEYAAIAYKLQLFPINRALGADRPARRVEVARILYSLHLQGLIP